MVDGLPGPRGHLTRVYTKYTGPYGGQNGGQNGPIPASQRRRTMPSSPLSQCHCHPRPRLVKRSFVCRTVMTMCTAYLYKHPLYALAPCAGRVPLSTNECSSIRLAQVICDHTPRSAPHSCQDRILKNSRSGAKSPIWAKISSKIFLDFCRGFLRCGPDNVMSGARAVAGPVHSLLELSQKLRCSLTHSMAWKERGQAPQLLSHRVGQ